MVVRTLTGEGLHETRKTLRRNSHLCCFVHDIDDLSYEGIFDVGHASPKSYHGYHTCCVSLKVRNVVIWRFQEIPGRHFAFIVLQAPVTLHLPVLSRDSHLVRVKDIPDGCPRQDE